MPVWRLHRAAKRLSEGHNGVPNSFQVTLTAELDKLKRVRCKLCDGRGHNVNSVARQREISKQCPLRKIVQKRVGRGKESRAALSAALALIDAPFEINHAGDVPSSARIDA